MKKLVLCACAMLALCALAAGAADKGPILIVYPNAWWYHEIDEAKIDSILDALEQGAPVEELLMA